MSLLANATKKLKMNPLISTEDIEKFKNLTKNIYIDPKQSMVTLLGVYLNSSFVKERIPYDDLPYYIWYYSKYKKGRFLFLQENGMFLNYDIEPEDERRLDNVIFSLKAEGKI